MAVPKSLKVMLSEAISDSTFSSYNPVLLRIPHYKRVIDLEYILHPGGWYQSLQHIIFIQIPAVPLNSVLQLNRLIALECYDI